MYKIQLPTRQSELHAFGIENLFKAKAYWDFIGMFLPAAKNCNEISGLPRCIFPGCHMSDQTVLTLSIDRREGISGKTTNVPDLTAWHSLQPWDRICTETNKPKPYKSVTDKRMLRPWLLLAVNHNKLQLFWKQKAGPEMKLLLEQHTAGKAIKCCCRPLPENETLLIYMQCPNLTKTNLSTTFTIKMLQSGYQVSLIKSWPVCHCWQHRSQSHWHCWWQSEILYHNSS